MKEQELCVKERGVGFHVLAKDKKIQGFMVIPPEISVQDETPPRDIPVKALMATASPGIAPDSIVPLKLPNKPDITNPVVYKAPEKEPAYQRIKYKVLSAHDIKERFCRKFYVRVWEECIYVYTLDTGTYRSVNSKELTRLIYEGFKPEIAEQSSSYVFREVEKFIWADSSLIYSGQANPFYWVFQNGYLDINGNLKWNDGSYFIITYLQCLYIPSAVCPNFDDFLNTVSHGNTALQDRILEMIGYILSLDNVGKCFFTLVGPKDTGKSLLANLIASFFAEDDVSALNIHDLSQRFNLVDIKGRRLNVCMDLTNKVLSNECVGIIKMLTGGDCIRTDVKYRDSQKFYNTAKLLFGTNHQIRIEGDDAAFLDRQIEIPFTNQVPPQYQNKDLLNILKSEKSGIINRAMEAYGRLRANNYVFTKCDNELPENMEIDHEKLIKEFVEGHFIITMNEKDKLSTEMIFAMYENYTSEVCVQPLAKNKFSEALNQLFGGVIKKGKIRQGEKTLQGYTGIKLKCSVPM